MTEEEDVALVALVIGGSGGVGRWVCKNLASRGYTVVFTYRSNASAARELESALATTGAIAIGLPLDVTDDVATTQLVNGVAADHGRIDTLVYAAGPYVEQRYVATLGAELFSNHVNEELLGFFNVLSPSLPHLRNVAGSIVAVTTFAVRKFPPRDCLSSVPKAGVEALIRAVAVEEGKYGVRANAVGPGALSDGQAIQNRQRGDITQEVIDAVLPAIPLRRLGTGQEVANAVCFLASREAAYVTGQSLDVDGGFQL